MKTVIFLGSGTSRAEGSPLKGQMFKEYFKSIQERKPDYYSTEMESELRTFFWMIWRKYCFNFEFVLKN
jgi:hypothetical protein